LAAGATAAALDSRALSKTRSMSTSVQRFLIEKFDSRISQLNDVPITEKDWPAGLDPLEIPWRRRTLNRMRQGRLLARLGNLNQITYGDLVRVRSMGAVSILDFICTLEAAITTMEVVASNTDGDSSAEAEGPHAILSDALDHEWLDQVSSHDPRFSETLPPFEGTLFDMLDRVTSAPMSDSPMVTERVLADAIDAAFGIVGRLEGLTLEQSLREYLASLSGYTGIRLNAYLARFGWAGDPPITLEQTGSMMGVTRERARQLQKRILDRMPKHPVVMPQLDQAIMVLTQHTPTDAKAASQLLLDRGITENRFHPACVIKAARDCGRDVPLKIARVQNRDMLTADATADLTRRVVGIAFVQIRASGTTNVFEVVAEADAKRLAVDDDQVKNIITGFEGFEMLSRDWFWVPGSSRLESLSKKLLSVSAPIAVGVLRDGIRREFRFRRTRSPKGWRLIVPPREVLAGFYKAHPSFVIDEQSLVRPVSPLDYRTELSPNEQILVDVLRSSAAGVLDRQGLAEGCRARGMNPNTMASYVSYCGVLAHLGVGLWTLRGTRVDPAAVEALREANAARPRTKRTVDYGWTEDGRLWVAFRLGSVYETTAVNIPSAVRHVLPTKDFVAESEGGHPLGRFRVYDQGQCVIPRDFLVRNGADEGDLLLAEFDLVSSVVKFALEDDERLEQIAPD
jgi:hypothetical protein